MSKFIIIAWRNVWRSRRRTSITLVSIMFALTLALVMSAFQKGAYDRMVHNFVHFYTGYFQIHAKGYQEEAVLSNAMKESDAVNSLIADYPDLQACPRIESFVFSSFGNQSKGAMLVGINPEAENKLTAISDKIIKGEFLSLNDNGIIISSRLAAFLKIDVGDSLLLRGQGLHGNSAERMFCVRGILKMPSPDLDTKIIYTSLTSAQQFFSADGFITAIAFNTNNTDKINEYIDEFKLKLDKSYFEVLSWEELQPEMVQQIKSDNISGLIMLGILYIVVAFGIVGTVLMITAERKKEFAVMSAMGMNKMQLILIQAVEMLFIGFMGIALGITVALSVILYFLHNPLQLKGESAQMMIDFGFEPIMPVLLQSDYFISQIKMVLVIILLSVMVSALKILQLKSVNSLKQ